MATLVSASRAQRASGHARLARRVADALGGRYSTELGIDAGAGDAEIERWFLAATLFGTRIPAAVAERTFGVLSDAGLARIVQARHIPLDDFIAFLDEGGSARYARARLKALSGIIGERYDGRAAMIGQQFSTYPALRAALDVLPGWGPVTIQLFLRELRGVWPGRAAAAGPRAEYAADTSATPAPARLPQRLSASPGWPPDVTPAARISKAAWSGSPWRITAGDGPMPGRAPVRPVQLVLCQPSTDRV